MRKKGRQRSQKKQNQSRKQPINSPGARRASPASRGSRPLHPSKKRPPNENRAGGSQLIKAKAVVDKNHKGFAFLVFGKDELEDLYLSADRAAQFFHGDRVLVVATPSGEIIRVQLIEHRFKELVGRFMSDLGKNPKNKGWVIYERKRSREEVPVPTPPAQVKTGDWVRAKLHFHSAQTRGQPPVTAEITEVYGPELPAMADIPLIAAEFNLTEAHPENAVLEAESLRLEIPGKDLQDREDLRNVPFITIDGETARDFDDAIYVERDGSGFILWVAVADVSHYVREGTALDDDARSRGTSVYFPERAFHMLPSALSEGLCSLRPKEPRLAMVAKIRYDARGTKGKVQVFNAVIESKRRATYNEMEAEFKANTGNANWEYRAHYDLYAQIREQRKKRGSIDFDLPEVEILVDPQGEPTQIAKRERLDAHRLIEEFMIAANESVTEWMMERKWPFVYRIHDEPSIESLDRFRKLAATVGFQVLFDEESVPPSVLAEVTERLEGHPAQLLLNQTLLRSMRQAIYSSIHGIHYGLASDAYTHFTSPIRRYPDLVVHRLLKLAIRCEQGKSRKPNPKELEPLEKDLEEIAEHCSFRERLASEAERESHRMKQVRLLKKHLGDEFDAKIIGMIERGLFAQLQEPFVEGMISKESMTDDFYEFNEERMIFYGKRKRRTFKIGDAIRIRVVRADLDRRQVDFALIDSRPTP